MADRLPTEFSLAGPDDAEVVGSHDAGPAPAGPPPGRAGHGWPDPRLLAACAVVAAASLAVMAAGAWMSASAASRQACVLEVQHLMWTNEGPAEPDVRAELLGRCGVELPDDPAGDSGDGDG